MNRGSVQVVRWSSGLVLLVVACGVAPGLSASWRWRGYLTYDDNPFRYSRSDLALFRQREEPARFPFRTTDDLDAELGSELSWRYDVLGRAGVTEAELRVHTFFSNWEKSYGSARVESGLCPWKGGKVAASYLVMPDYLLRYFRNPESSDTGDYAACRFTEHLGSVRLAQQLNPLTISPEYAFEYDDYLLWFDHFDTRIHRLGGEADLEVARNFTVRGEYEYRLAQATGPVPDASYIQHRVGGVVLTRPRHLARLSFDAGYSFARRTYTTQQPGTIDPSHAGRVDNVESVDLTLGYRLVDVVLKGDFEMEWRTVVSAYSAEISDVKDYRRTRFGLGVEYRPSKKR
jgi:hypothetical protein